MRVENKKFNEFLQDYLHDNNIKRDDFAKKVGVSNSTLYRWISGVGKPDAMIVPNIARATGVPVEKLGPMIADTNGHMHKLTYMLDCLHYMVGESRKDMLNILGISHLTYQNWRKGPFGPSISNMLALSKTLGWDIHTIDHWATCAPSKSVDDSVMWGKTKRNFIMIKERKLLYARK